MSIKTLVLYTAVVLLLLTNPSKKSYARYLALMASAEVSNTVCPQVNLLNPLPIAEAGTLLEILCRGAISAGGFIWRDRIEYFIEVQTKRENFLLYSLYTTKLPGKTIQTVGIFGCFITFAES